MRLGVKRFDDPVILNTLAVVDQRLRRTTPNGAVLAPLQLRRLRRACATAAVGHAGGLAQTFGRLWPIFAGERGEYELLAGRPANTAT